MTRDGREQFVAQDRDEIAGPKRGALMRQQNLQPFARDRRVPRDLKKVKRLMPPSGRTGG